MIKPRKYQIEAVEAVIEASKRGISRQLISLPTGTGKTIIFALLAKQLNTRTLILAHREELLQQARQKMLLVWPEANVDILRAKKTGGLLSEVCVQRHGRLSGQRCLFRTCRSARIGVALHARGRSSAAIV